MRALAAVTFIHPARGKRARTKRRIKKIKKGEKIVEKPVCNGPVRVVFFFSFFENAFKKN